MTLRDFLKDNMFDGYDTGGTSRSIGPLLDDVCYLVTLWMIEKSGAEGAIEQHYLGDVE